MKKIFLTLLGLALIFPQQIFATAEINVDQEPSHYSATWDSQSAYPILNAMEITTIWVKFKNTGSATWYNYGPNPVRLGTSNLKDRSSAFYKHTWISTNRTTNLSESEVAPGEIGTFEFYIKAPETSGNYQEYFQPLVEGITWMQDWGVYWSIDVDSNSDSTTNEENGSFYDYSCAWNSQSSANTLAPGATQTVWVKFKNTGNKTWYNTGNNPIHLGTDRPSDRQSGFYHTSWLSTNRSANLQESTVNPGEIGTFNFTIQAPNTSGDYKEYFRPVVEGITWMQDWGVYWNFSVSSSNNNNSFSLTSRTVSNGISLNWSQYSNSISGYKVVRSETNSNPTYPNDWWVYLSDPSDMNYIDTSVQSGHSYYYRIGAYSSDTGVIAYTNNVYQAYSNNNQNNDSTFSLSGTQDGNSIKLSWDSYSSDNISGYKVVRSETNSNPTYPSDWWIYLSNPDENTYLDTSVESGHSYYYRIGAYSSDSGVIAYSNNIYITTSGNQANSTMDLEGYIENGKVKLNWNKYSNNSISGYKVVRSETNSSPTYPDDWWVYLSDPNTITYNDTTVQSGHSYYYRIGAYLSGTGVIYYSNNIYLTVSSSNNNSSTFSLSASSQSNGVRLSWDAYSNDSISGYKILRSKTNNSPTYPADYLVYVSGLDNTDYLDQTGDDGQYYYYRIGAYQNGQVIGYSNSVYAVQNNGDSSTTDNSDFVLSGSSMSNGIHLNWDKYDTESINGYKLLRSETSSNLTYPPYYKYISGSSSSAYVDTDLVSGHSYYYRIGAYKNGEVISYTNTIKVTAE